MDYILSHTYSSILAAPDLITAVVVGDGEADTGPLATSWHSNKFLNPRRDGAVCISSVAELRDEPHVGIKL